MDELKTTLRRDQLSLDAAAWEKVSILESRGGTLALGWPHPQLPLASDCLTWWPRGVPDLRTTGIVSSRLGRKLDRKDDLFRVLRSACAQLDPRRQMLLSAEGTTTGRFVTRAAQLFGLSLLDVIVARPKQTFAAWLEQMVVRNPEHEELYWPCFVSPSMRQGGQSGEANTSAVANREDESVPLRDRIAVQASDQLVVLHLRDGGNLSRLLVDRLRYDDRKGPSIYLSLGSTQLVPPSAADRLMEQGAVGWLLWDMSGHENEASVVAAPFGEGPRHKPAAIVSQPPDEPWRFLTHCTRRAQGRWPDQLEQEYLDELILGEPTRDRSSLATLMRIIGTRHLLAAGATIRSGTEVVSFTEANFAELARMRQFRAHRARWDFEPYGICIDQHDLKMQGTRPVAYGNDELWDRLADAERPFFQKSANCEQEGVDWRREREWRHPGDIDLDAIPSSSGLVFVPTQAEAQHVARVSRWPVTVVNW